MKRTLAALATLSFTLVSSALRMADRRKDIVYYPFEEWIFDDDDDWINDPEIDAILEAHKRSQDEVIPSDDEIDELLLDPPNDAIMEAYKRSREEAFSSDDREEEKEEKD